MDLNDMSKDELVMELSDRYEQLKDLGATVGSQQVELSERRVIITKLKRRLEDAQRQVNQLKQSAEQQGLPKFSDDPKGPKGAEGVVGPH